MKEKFIIKLKNLVLILQKNNNNSYKYFLELVKRTKLADEKNLKNIAQEIASSSSIVQYANFTYEEESAWNEVWSEAHNIWKD